MKEKRPKKEKPITIAEFPRRIRALGLKTPSESVRIVRRDRNARAQKIEVRVETAGFFENSESLKKVLTGLSQKGSIKRGSFAKYAK